ncbi:hypothetical protein K488DRAFT_74373 [Vararia minispora EC-137]|uniref:Uncharacterized protein n=1 Tax=Vararia minispora EC-137 TaxID=1314806 RepID=A0ACB8Q7A0_9AGAM|nr:hypothetical protein K488DRAFT_74373 [Vararia minispora EC-137]
MSATRTRAPVSATATGKTQPNARKRALSEPAQDSDNERLPQRQRQFISEPASSDNDQDGSSEDEEAGHDKFTFDPEGVQGEPVGSRDWNEIGESDAPDDIFEFQRHKGRLLGRYVVPHGNFKDIIETGLANYGKDGVKRTMYQENLYDMFLRVLSYDTPLHHRNYQGRLFSKNIIDWEGSSYNKVLRHEYGFRNEVTGRLLCPVTKDWNDPEISRQLCLKEIVPTIDDIPRFLYPNSSPVDLTELAKGFMQGELLEAVFTMIWFAPSTALGTGRTTRSSKAVIYGLDHVTIESIAYVAMLIRFVLSDQPTFTPGGAVPSRGSWPLGQFCLKLIDHAYNTLLPDECRALLTWWNESIFPNHMIAAPTKDKTSASALMEKQLAAKLAKQSEARDKYDDFSMPDYEDEPDQDKPDQEYDSEDDDDNSQGVQSMVTESARAV